MDIFIQKIIFQHIFNQNYTTYIRFLRILVLLRALKVFKKLDYMSFIFQVLKNSFFSFVSILLLFFLFICFNALIGRSLYKPLDEKIFPDNQHFSCFSQAFMTVFTVITLDNWFDLMQLGREDLNGLMSISSYLLLIICIGT